jgi:hypothetical protein
MDFSTHLYLILHPTAALIGSQLSPEQLARHYTVGPTRHYRGKVIFAEIDPAFRHPYFAIDGAMAEMKPHEDGRPKATKYISSYRVLEHIDFSAIRGLHITSEQGYSLELDEGPAPQDAGATENVYAEITPLRMLVLSRMDLAAFGSFITDPSNSVGAPKFFYTQLDILVDDFLAEYERNPFMQPPIPNLHPAILRDAIVELRGAAYKSNKGLLLGTNLDNFSYRLIRRGFMFASQKERKFYPLPPLAEIEKKNLKFYRSL